MVFCEVRREPKATNGKLNNWDFKCSILIPDMEKCTLRNEK